MHPAEIQAALKLQGYSQAQIATMCGVQASAVSMVINGRGRSRPIEEQISVLLRLPLSRLWPHWYEDMGAQYKGVREKPDLTDEELMILEVYRSLSGMRKQQFQSMLELFRRGEPPRAEVTADRGSVAAGGDVNFGKGSGRRKK
jgi:lambda repressor-like predicted transcriptional regulator